MFQKVLIIGRLGKAPTGGTKGETEYCNFSVATSRGYGDKEETTWFRTVAFGKTAEACSKYLGKGDLVAVEGHIRESTYTDDENVERRSWALIAETVKFLTPKGESSGGSGNEPDLGHDSTLDF